MNLDTPRPGLLRSYISVSCMSGSVRLYEARIICSSLSSKLVQIWHYRVLLGILMHGQ